LIALIMPFPVVFDPNSLESQAESQAADVADGRRTECRDRALFFIDREPVGPSRITVPVRRMRHFRFNDLADPKPVPGSTGYASVVGSDRLMGLHAWPFCHFLTKVVNW
jgi:hypothetical protein